MSSFTALYKEISSQDDISLASEEYSEKPTHKSRTPQLSTVLLSISTLVLGIHAIYTSAWGERPECTESFQHGYKTEWTPAKESIMTKKVTYTSALRYNATDQTYYRDFDPNLPQYAGKPSPAIDKAWADLLEGQYLAITKDEAMELDDPVTIQGYYLGEVEVMHSLHCLNAIRKALSPEYYKTDEHHHLLEKVKEIHVDHCLEQLRQNIQCAGDLTPLLLRPWGEGDNELLIGTPQVHTCRDWDSFRSWYTGRGTKFGKVSATAV